jgi:hypothetical protein
MSKLFISLLLIASLAGVAANKASTALPGDMLYPFKIQVNDRIASWMALTQAQKAANASRTVAERLTELENLTERGIVDSSVELKLLTGADDSIHESMTHAQALADSHHVDDALRATAQLQIMLSTHIAILSALNSPLVRHFQSTLDRVSALRGTLAK